VSAVGQRYPPRYREYATGPKGRFRKKRAFDCGNPGCLLCHGDKYPKREKTRQELLAGLKLREEIKGGWHKPCSQPDRGGG